MQHFITVSIYVGILISSLNPLLIAQELVVPPADNSSYTNKTMFGYQGWFAHPDDMSPRPYYWHWGNMGIVSQNELTVEMYPDLRELCNSEKYETAYTLQDGTPAQVFSSGNKNTVMRHMKWVRDYSVDGVFLQRFISEYGDRLVMEFRDSTTTALMKGCEKYERVFSIMYDGVENAVENIKTDWMHLVDDLKILDSPAYLNHNGKPLVALWGYTVRAGATLDQLNELLDWFHTDAAPQYRASVKLGIDSDFLNRGPEWLAALSKAEVLSPWSVGGGVDDDSYNYLLMKEYLPAKEWCDERDILFVPVLYPGFSWHNLFNGSNPQNEIPRNGGEFFWMHAFGAIDNNFESLYLAMFDEVDEGTAFFKLSENDTQSPVEGYWLDLDADGFTLPSDWYLRCAKKAAETLRGNIPLTETLGTPPEGIMAIRPDINECVIVFIFPNFLSIDEFEISVDGGISFPYTVKDDLGEFRLSGLPDGEYDIFVRYDSSEPIPMGKVCLEGSCIVSSLSESKGSMNKTKITFLPNPCVDQLYIKGITEASTITLRDRTGKVLGSYKCQDKSFNLNFQGYLDGIYFLEIRTARYSQVAKIVKQNN